MIQTFSSELAGQILEEIKKAKRILMHCHPSPDGDSLGSTLGLKHTLSFLNKDITVIKGDSEMKKYLSVLPGYETIVQKNIFEIDLAEFDLFLILDSGSLGQISKLKDPVFPPTLKTIVIDHHISNPGFADINLVDSSYPATCQIIFDLIKVWNIPLNREIALCLFVGMYTDTGGFRYKATTSNTYFAAAELTKVAPDFSDILFAFENSNSESRVRLHGLLLNSIETYFSNSVAIASLSYEEYTKQGFTHEDVAVVNVGNEMKSVVGWNITVLLLELEPGIIKVSFRTRDQTTFDLSKLAVNLGGGGHAGAAGAQIKGTLEEAKQKVVEAIKTTYPGLFS